MKIFVGIAVVGLSLLACQSNQPFDPSGVRVTVDSTVYHLQPMQGNAWYQINLSFTIVNNNNYEVFLSQTCPSWQLARADESDKTELILGSYACLAADLGSELPRVLPPGERFSGSFRLTGSNSSLTRPPITIENNTGTLVLSWWLMDPDGRPVGRARSSAFRVEPPG